MSAIGRFAPTPVDLYLSNTTLNGTYEVRRFRRIYEILRTTNSITVENNVTVEGLTILKAGNNIHLKSGFHAPNGINFTAKIGTISNTLKRFYYLKDHLGSIRVVVNETGDIVSYNDYDPWGMTLSGRSDDIGYLNAKYKFTGKERDKETGYDYFGARYFDGRIGRWLQVDPLADEYPDWSSYNYTLNNPIKNIDADGKWVNYWWISKTFKDVYIIPEVIVTAQVIPYPLNPVAPPIVGPMESPGKTGKGIIELFNKVNEIGKQIELTKLILATYITSLILPTNLESEGAQDAKLVKEVLKGKKGSIKNAPLPPGSPSWGEIENKTMGEIKDGAFKNIPGYKTIKKLLGDKRFDK